MSRAGETKKTDLPIRDEKLYARGYDCRLYYKDVKDMDTEELIIFIGFLDELVEQVRKGVSPMQPTTH